jgi:hypothetical protein
MCHSRHSLHRSRPASFFFVSDDHPIEAQCRERVPSNTSIAIDPFGAYADQCPFLVEISDRRTGHCHDPYRSWPMRGNRNKSVRYRDLICTLRNFTVPLSLATPLSSLRPRPCCNEMCPLLNFASCAPSTVFCPLSVTLKVEPLAVIS